MVAGFMERLAEGPLVGDGGYFLELERRCLLAYATGVPNAVLDYPEGLLELHREFAAAGSEILQAFTYGVQPLELEKEKEVHRVAVELAREAAGPDRFVVGTLTGPGLSGGPRYPSFSRPPLTEQERSEVRRYYERRIDQQMAVGVDAFFCELYTSLDLLSPAIPAINEAGVPAVAMIVFYDHEYTMDGYTPSEAMKRLEDLGADVVGVQCMRPWDSMRQIVRQVRQAVSIPVISQPSGYENEVGQVYNRALHLGATYPAVELRVKSRFAAAEYAREARAFGVDIIGACCGTLPFHIRAMAEALGKRVALPDQDRGYRAAPAGRG